MSIPSATRPSQLVGASNGPIRWGEAMRIRGLGPSLLSSPSWVNWAEEALDASPHPNGLDDLGAIGLGTKWDGPKADSSRVYELYTHPCRYRPFLVMGPLDPRMRAEGPQFQAAAADWMAACEKWWGGGGNGC